MIRIPSLILPATVVHHAEGQQKPGAYGWPELPEAEPGGGHGAPVDFPMQA